MIDKPRDRLFADYAIKAEPTLPSSISDWPSLAAVAAEGAYRLPTDINFAFLQRMIIAKVSDAEDHLVSLREDPGYFALCIVEKSEHQACRILDERGRTSLKLREPIFWHDTIGDMLSMGYGSISEWKDICAQLPNLKRLREEHTKTLSSCGTLPMYPGLRAFDPVTEIEKLPSGFEEALRRFCPHLERAQTDAILDLRIWTHCLASHESTF